MTDVNDDLATYVPPYKVVAVVPVHGRLPLLPLTIKRLIHKNKCEVICVGDGLHEKEVCIEAGAHWVASKNKPLGGKWNRGFQAAKDLKPDACLYVGSSDWLSDSWTTHMKPHVDLHQIAGVPGCYFMDIDRVLRLVNWKGYVGTRSDETIGIGRMLSAELLQKINWKPFDDLKDSSLDRSMKDICAKVGCTDFKVIDDRLKAVSISTSQWENKHQFKHHWQNFLPSEKLNPKEIVKEFPESLELQSQLYASICK